MIGLRFDMMVRSLRKDARNDDFRVEKDKCEMYRFVGIEPETQAILVNKSSVHFRADFDHIAETILTCTAPGPMPLSPASLPFRRLAPGMRLEPLGEAFRPQDSP